MASRFVFLPTEPSEESLFREVLVDFDWVPGMALSQGRKSVENLHSAITNKMGISKILEISTRSQTHLGISLSAFNLCLSLDDRKVHVEVIYQASKVFENGVPFEDLLQGSSLDAKQNSRLRESGALTGFRFNSTEWPLAKTPNFYDYIYILGLFSSNLHFKLYEFEAFTDIAFSQSTLVKKTGKPLNCQARSAAIFVSLTRRMAEESIPNFLSEEAQRKIPKSEQLDLFF